jgi:hypothetical protein
MHGRPELELGRRLTGMAGHQQGDLYSVDYCLGFTPTFATVHDEFAVGAAYERERFGVEERNHRCVSYYT